MLLGLFPLQTWLTAVPCGYCQIYPSDFGKDRLKLEETQGPLELRTLPNDSEDDTEEDK